MSLASVCIRRPVLAIVMNIVIVIFGVIGFSYLGVREFPSLDPPIITVRTTYTGANADIIESQITEPLEKAINGIAGVREISSASNLGSSSITVEFDLGIDLETAANDVRDKVSQATRFLPPDIDSPPIVTKADANSDAIMAVTLQSNTHSHLEVSNFAENVIAERLQTIPGVSTVQIWGQKRYAMRLWLDPAKLSSYRLTAMDVKTALDRENVELPSGKIAGDRTELTVKTFGRLTTEEEFNNLIIFTDGVKTVRLRDVGYAILGPENEETILRESNIPMIGVAIVPQPGSNHIDISEEFYRRVESLKKEIPHEYSLFVNFDNTQYIKRSVTEVQETILIAVVLVILIVFLFFREWIVAVRPIIDIPVSLIGAFFIMYLADFSVNVLTLLAVVLATGLVVDDGIVVAENIYKKIERGMEPFEAAFKGSQEIFFAVISTSITLAAVFMPIIFLEGFVGRLFREFGVVIAGAVLISAFVSLSLTPMLSARLVRRSKEHTRFYKRTEPFFVWLNQTYRDSLRRFMKRRYLAGVVMVVAIGVIFLVGSLLPRELAPLEDRGNLRMIVSAPEGASFQYTDRFIREVVDFIVDSIPERQVAISVTSPGFFGSGAANTGFIRLMLVDPTQRTRTQEQIVQYLSANLSRFPAARTSVIQQQTIAVSGGRGLPVQFVIQAPNFESLRERLPRFMDAAQQDATFQFVDVNLKFNRPEVRVLIHRDKARSLGVSTADIAQVLRLSFSGQRFGFFTMDGKQYSVIGQFLRENRDEPIDLRSVFVRGQTSGLIQLDNVIQLEEESSPPQLYHYNRYVSATVSAQLAQGRTLGEGIDAMRAIAEETLDESFATALSGTSRDFEESSSNTLFAFLFALVLIYLVLAAQFESFREPLIIMVTVPLAMGGAILSLWYFSQTLNIFSQIGMIMLVGLVTKNGILIVEFANQLRAQGRTVWEAAEEAAVMRFRPILMTSLSTILGAMPIALALGAGAESRIPMGIVVIGGMFFSSILTLYVIPVMYGITVKEKHALPMQETTEPREEVVPVE